ncbi:unnamed protein product [Rotaria magnacalcarata]|uniref:Uncharacterized protein n=3 Tax=Rotaria magnacalcarata TaxID=392030 RepID=A0A814WPK7_9BILA|nr:unnamed protein product [Rotaria magnacalcarata]CAF1922996.1 unnamed protein product [Rotaria magnacalcarata]CAF2032901.1 unnamed protein product [Rotaria magnacalcarata]CAF2053819.1 unnamed protein product [Rotaria magnacalcarata]CAF3993259.1 unnamed protein product [Rotaria magnacalcarata]
MPTTLTSDRYSAASSSSTSSTSSNSYYNNNNHNNSSLSQSSRSSSTFLPLRPTKSSLYLSKLNNPNYHSMQSLKIQKQYKTNQTPVARISPLVINQQISSSDISRQHEKDEGWLSCEELETIEKRFTDLLQEPAYKKTAILNNYQQHEQRAKSCDRLAIDNEELKSKILPMPRKSLIGKVDDEDVEKCIPLPASIIYDNNTRPRSQTSHQSVSSLTRTVLSANDILKVESSYRSIGTQVFACRCLCDLYITTTERLAKLEDWIRFQHGLPVWLLNSGTNPKRQSRLSLIIAECGSGFPIWQDTINGFSDVKQARAQHITFRLSDQITLAVLRFNDFSASKEFFSYYQSIRNDDRYEHLFSTTLLNRHRSSSCGSLLKKRRKTQKHISKSSISNPCQFQHITCLQAKDRTRLISLDQCLAPHQNYSNNRI